MSAVVLDGKAIAREIRRIAKARVETLKRQAGMVPGLAVVLVGNDSVSHVYVNNKIKACAEVGIHSQLHEFDAGIDGAAVIRRIEQLNADPAIHGILVQLPLPSHFDIRAGVPNLILAQMVRTGAVVIDVGINRLSDGRLVGDVDFEGVRRKASYITPVPGGVGPMTVTMLLVNTISAAERAVGISREEPQPVADQAGPAAVRAQ